MMPSANALKGEPSQSEERSPVEMSPTIQKYFSRIESEVKKAYAVAQEARARGFDPEKEVSIPLAKDLAERVEGLVSVAHPPVLGSGLARRILDLEEQYGKLSWKVALHIALETAQGKFCAFGSQHKAMEVGIRVGLAYLTLGVVASPLEGFVGLKLKKRLGDGKEYFCLMFSGPIRSAGGTAASVCVVVADYIRKQMGYAEYDPTEQEVKRAVTELYDYHERITNLQYLPSEEEIRFIVSHLPVQIDGDASEPIEVSNYKDLPRVEANKLRNGFCLVTGECLCQKAAKLEKQLSEWGRDFGLEHWRFLKDFVRLQKQKKAKKKEVEAGLHPDFTYLKDLVAGRPILGFPLRPGGFRLRYGRARNSGYSSAAIHPATTYILDKFIAIGTQLKLERPGKAASMSTCGSIEGPLVLLEDGGVERVNDVARAKLIAPKVKEILYLGDILINYGDFFNRAHPLVPAGYCEEWWVLEMGQALKNANLAGFFSQSGLTEQRLQEVLSEKCESTITAKEALAASRLLKVPLHPKYTFYWPSLSLAEAKAVLAAVQKGDKAQIGGETQKLILPYEPNLKRHLELLGVPHTLVAKEHIVIPKDEAAVLWELAAKSIAGEGALAYVSSSGVPHRDRLGTCIGARMGRPEKGKVRKLDGQPHCLFPVGEQGGRLRSFQDALKKGEVSSDFPIFRCGCGNETVLSVCERCGGQAVKQYYCKSCGVMPQPACQKHGQNASYVRRAIDIVALFKDTVAGLALGDLPDLIKGVRGTSNREHLPEHLAKGILRAKHNLPVNKDGTTRYDMTQLAITHFTPAEISTPISKLKELGYSHDVDGKPLEQEHQVIELFPQDIILPACEDAPEEGADKVLLRVTQFIDDMLARLYKAGPYYKAKKKEDLIGQLVIALAPHTSAGIVGRILGFSRTQGFYAHPMLHAATRRDCLGQGTYVSAMERGKWSIDQIGNVIEGLRPDKKLDNHGTLGKQTSNLRTFSQRDLQNISSVSKHKPASMLKISLEDGRQIEVTDGHKMYTKGMRERKAKELKQGDQLVVAYKRQVEEKDIAGIFLPEALGDGPDVMLRHVRKYLNGFEKQSIRRNYVYRDSYPLAWVKDFLKKQGKTLADLPDCARIAIKRDIVELPLHLALDQEFLEIVGLYIAGGYVRKNDSKKGLYQLSIAGNEFTKGKVKKVFLSRLGLRPSHENKDQVVFSSKLLYKLFKEYLSAGANAHDKRIPGRFLTLKKEKLAALLRGYFEGDGSVSLTDTRVACDTVSEGLPHDLSFALSRFGIYVKFYRYEKEPGPAVKAFYARKRREIPLFKITKAIIPSDFVSRFAQIGFISERKNAILRALAARKPKGMRIEHDEQYVYPKIRAIEHRGEKESYCFNVEVDHNFFANDILVHNCDGDEACVTLLMDALLNFSRTYLPNSRGATQDAPLVLTSRLTPAEVDDMVFDVDIAESYPIELYEAAQRFAMPWEVKVDQLGRHLKTPAQYEGARFTHPVSSINEGVLCSAYKLLPTMEEKLRGQMALAAKIRAVDEAEVARIVIEKHFIRDIRGNLRKFTQQEFRCVNCNEKFRRPPLIGKCTQCGGRLLFTISEGSIVKYLEPALSLAHHYNVPAYLQQSLELTKRRVESMFGKDKEKQEGLGKWFG